MIINRTAGAFVSFNGVSVYVFAINGMYPVRSSKR